MPGFAAPTAREIKDLGGLGIAIENLDAPGLDAKLVRLRAFAETKVAFAVTQAVFRSDDLSADEARALKLTVAQWTVIYYLRSPQAQEATGTEEALLMDAGEIQALIADLKGEAAEVTGQVLEARQRASGNAAPTTVVPPLLITSTFDHGGIAVSPSRKLEMGDERDDIPAGWEPR
jgi:hypothetical protein